MQRHPLRPAAALACLALASHAALGQGMSLDVAPLDHRPLDAEYSKSLERVVTVASTPVNTLHLYDPLQGTDLALDLSLTPTCVGLAPDGLTAAVGHDGWITYVDLSSLTVLSVLPVSCDVFDIVLAANDWIYAFPRVDQWERIRCIEIATGQETDHTGSSIRAGTRVRPHPDGDSIYGADNGLSPSDIEKYSIGAGTAQYEYDSPYHGSYAMCGDLWISEDGLRIFTRCGNVFRASPNQAEDMTYNGSLSNASSLLAVDHSTASGKVLVIDNSTDTDLQIYDHTFLGFDEAVPLPARDVGGVDYASEGRFVFHDSSGSRAFVLVQADAASGLLLDYGVATYEYPGACQGAWESTCIATDNSTGSPGAIAIDGSLSVAQNDGEMLASDLPPGAPGLFIFGPTAGQLPFGDGFLCVDMFASGIHRPWPVVRAAADGTVAQDFDFPGLPAAAQIHGGSTQHFQFWFRDRNGPGGTGFNLTNAARVTFCN